MVGASQLPHTSFSIQSDFHSALYAAQRHEAQGKHKTLLNKDEKQTRATKMTKIKVCY